MSLLTLNKLCELVGQDRRAIAPLLEAVPYTQGPNNSHVYESAQALAAIYPCRHKDGGPEFTLAEAKIRNELAAAKLREVTVSQKLEELVPASISRMAINAFINHVRCKFDELRRRGAIDHEWINACGRRFAEILADLTVQHGLEFAKATLKPEDVQTLKDRGFPEQPSQDQSQP
jgi:hypothetical protein